MHIFCDESGNTGSDLLNKEQPVFSLASTCLDADVAARLIKPLLRRGQTEAKYSKLKGSVSGQNALIEFFMSAELSSSTAKAMLTDKHYYLITHLVDKLIEPPLYEHGIDMYASDAHVRLTNVWYYAGKYVFPYGHWKKVLTAFEQALRCPSKGTFAIFDQVLTIAASKTPYEHRDVMTGLLMARGRLDEFIGVFRNSVTFDPAPDLLTALVHKWMAEYQGKFNLTHDKSKPLARNEKFFRALMSDAPSRIIGYGDRQVEMPLRVSAFSFADSRDFAQLQVADIIAGATIDALLAWSGKRPAQVYHEKLKTTQLQDLVVGGMLPNIKMETSPPPEPGQQSLVDGSAAFLQEIGYRE